MDIVFVCKMVNYMCQLLKVKVMYVVRVQLSVPMYEMACLGILYSHCTIRVNSYRVLGL